MKIQGVDQWALNGRCLFLIGAILCSLAKTEVSTSNDVSRDVGGGGGDSGKLKIEGGWSEVKKGWPVEYDDFFLATEKGHHFIESQNLPKDLKFDLKVTFQYYYSFTKTKPVLQMTPCTKNIFLEDEATEDKSNKWITHTYIVERGDCAKRNEIAYNVLLHDAGDVFAWKLMKIENQYIPSATSPAPTTARPQTNTGGPTTQKTVSNITPDSIAELIDDESIRATTIVPRAPTTRPTTSGPVTQRATEAPVTEKATTQTVTSPRSPPRTTAAPTTERATTRSSPPRTTAAPTTKRATTRSSPIPSTATPTTEKVTTQSSPTSTAAPTSKKPRDGTNSANTELPTENPTTEKLSIKDLINKDPTTPATNDKTTQPAITGKPVDQKTTPGSEDARKNRPNLNDDDISDANLNQRRRKRETKVALGKPSDDKEFVSATCVPSSCNKHQFRMARFSPLVKGLPKRPTRAQASKYFVNLKNQPLKMKVESHDESLAEVDTCVNFLLYMEAGTEVDFLLADGGADSSSSDERSKERTLESIKRKPGDSTAGQWDQFYRCISDYIPQYTPKIGADNSLRLILRPKGTQQPGQVALLIAESEASYLAHLYRKQSFLPDIKRLSDTDALKKSWIVDRDGRSKPELTQTTTALATTGGSNQHQQEEKMLRISNIDVTQESFDLTSRWLQIKDAETLELPILFVYKAEQADWVDQVDFEYQRAGDSSDDWISQVAYKAETPASIVGSTEGSTQLAPDTTSEATTANSSQASSSSKPKIIDLPIKLKGLDSNEFRLRLRHHLHKDEKQVGGTFLSKPSSIFTGRTLNIKSLAFADVCSYGRPYCQNKGECRPTGPAQAECICPRGFSGRFCEHVRPCDVLYESNGKQLTGNELCKSVGARCVDQLPVMRCEWPNDQFYQCKALYKLDASGLTYVPNGDQSPHLGGADGKNSEALGGGQQEGEDQSNLSPEERLNRLKSVVGQQAKLIIILAVFIVAILVFAVVLVGSMVGRLRKSSKRLKRSQGEVHELSRRAIHPGGFGGGAPSLSGRPSSSSPSRALSGTTGGGGSGGGPFNKNNNNNKGGSPASVIGYNNSAFDVES